ncbi:MAG TPA: macro domain-containing protein [Candidatus Faecisoma merdavium]|nr:macro domain-containing protein [Candidatus Faecisoma merdavium]
MAKLNIVCGNILDYLDNKDLIVNSSNENMLCGSGVCNLIYKKANKKLLEEYCKKQYKDNMKVNEIRFTTGFNLGIDILHIYCPKYYEYKDNNVAIDDLLFSYYKIVIEAKKNMYKGIISVSLGTGAHGYKHNDIAKKVVDLLNYLVLKYDIDFTLVLPNEETKEMYCN